jgi:hypothetical protein
MKWQHRGSRVILDHIKVPRGNGEAVQVSSDAMFPAWHYCLLGRAWIHGDYMEAINLGVLHEALRVQHALIGRGFDEVTLTLGDQHPVPIPRQ